MPHRDHTVRLILLLSGVLAFLGGAALATKRTPNPVTRTPLVTTDALRATAHPASSPPQIDLPETPDLAIDLTRPSPAPRAVVHTAHWTLKPTPMAR